MRVWQSKTPAYISHTFFLRRPRGFNTTGPFLMCDLFWNLLSKQPYILQLLHFNSLSRRREHQTSTAPPGLAAGIGRHRDLHRSPLRFLTSTPKPRAEGSSPSAPAKKVRYPLLRHLTFSLVCGMSWQRGTAAPRAVRVVGACSPVGCVQARPRRQPRQVLLLLPKKPAETLRFCRFFCTCCMGMRFALVQTSGFLT